MSHQLNKRQRLEIEIKWNYAEKEEDIWEGLTGRTQASVSAEARSSAQGKVSKCVAIDQNRRT